MTPSVPPGSHYSRHEPQPPYDHRLSSFPSHAHSNRASRFAPAYGISSHTPSNSRPPAGSISRQLPPLPSMPPSQSASVLPRDSGRRERHPDWDEFYKNGMPKEIIVIDDDSPAPEAKKTRRNAGQTPNQNSEMMQPATKKRKIGQTTAYDSARDQYTAYSHGRTYSQDKSGSNTISTDRTTSLQTTAPTSLSSHGSAGAAYAEDATVGQKRKRVTRQQIADEKRRKDIDILGDPNSIYVPPPKPPIKAKEVQVQTIKDVSKCSIQ